VALWAEFERTQKKFDPTAVALMKMLLDETGNTSSPPHYLL
jgi:hypothetical protein